MNKWMKVIVAVLVLASLRAEAQVGGKSKADPRLRASLTEAGLSFAEQPNGNFKLHFTLEKERTHIVVAESTTSTMGVIEVREIWAVGWKGADKPDAETANALLSDNSRRKVGAWELHQEKDGSYFAIFNVKVSTDCDGEAMKSIVNAVATVADELEAELLGTDEF